MASLDTAVKHLQSECNRLERELERINAALSALGSLNGTGRGGRRTTVTRTVGRQRHVSAAARRRMAAAQKAR